MTTTVLFEHPLNEKIRTWLRIEFLLSQLHACPQITDHFSALSFFRNLSELLDIFERSELRTDILKELDKQQQKMQAWRNVSGVDADVVNALSDKLQHCASVLSRAPRIGQPLRDDRLISLVRQRMSIPGGCCSFDLPVLHIWLHMPQKIRDEKVNQWLEALSPLTDALALVMELIRQSGTFRTQASLNGFYQDNAEGSDLLRLQLVLKEALYPQISGHKMRYAIRFLPVDSERGEIPERFDFQLACC
ncbi:cell division protein ZapD [Enterobacteriaceae bacterium LUAb1]